MKNKIKLPKTDEIRENILLIPTHLNLTNNGVDHIISSINKFENI